jgi:hypothetical protein
MVPKAEEKPRDGIPDPKEEKLQGGESQLYTIQ